MDSIILKTFTQFVLQFMLIVSITFVLRGHNHPGGGFIGGLVAVSAIALYVLAFGVTSTKFKEGMRLLLALGVAILLLILLQGYFLKGALLAASWYGKIGSPIIFDFGIYFIIIGSISWLIVLLAEKK